MALPAAALSVARRDSWCVCAVSEHARAQASLETHLRTPRPKVGDEVTRLRYFTTNNNLRIALIGNFGACPDEGMKKLCAQFESAVCQHHEVMTVQTSDF